MKFTKAKELTPDIEEFMDNLESSAVGSMVDFMKEQQKTALGLTKLIVEYSDKESFTPEEIFSLFEEASNVVAETFSTNE